MRSNELKNPETALYAINMSTIMAYAGDCLENTCYGFQPKSLKMDITDKINDKYVFGRIEFEKSSWDCLDMEHVLYWSEFEDDYVWDSNYSPIYHISKYNDNIYHAIMCGYHVINNNDVYISKDKELLRDIAIKQLLKNTMFFNDTLFAAVKKLDSKYLTIYDDLMNSLVKLLHNKDLYKND